jgi:beta-N-acetylhexosaminidase
MSPIGNANLTDSQRAGQLLVIGIDGTRLDGNLKDRLQAVTPGGIILFARNLQDASQVAAFCRELNEILPIPPLLAIDQEGGRVNRLKGIFPAIPSNFSLAERPSAEALVRQHAQNTGQGLRQLGFNINFAPVLDLSLSTSPNGIGDRAYGDDPDRVVRMAGIFLQAQALAGVLGCGKHFPGLGGAVVDSHLELPVIPRSAEQIWSEDLHPYRALREELPMVMVGHAFYPALQGKSPQPATLSEAVVRKLLRERIGYRGVILTDDLEMGAVDQQKSAGEVVLQALRSGNDLVMYCKTWDRVEEAHATLTRALRSGSLARRQVDESLTRLFSLKERLSPAGQMPAFDLSEFDRVCRSLHQLDQASA